MGNINLPRPPQDVRHVSKLPDKVQGDATQIKKVFDQGAEDIRAFLNDDLIPELEGYLEEGVGGDGESGATFTPAVSEYGDLSWTNDKGLDNPDPVNIRGPQGVQGPQGPAGANGATGPQGPAGADGKDGMDGKDFRILGYYASLSALEAAVPSPSAGDAYGVGSAAPYDIYIWDGANRAWVNNGSIQGPAGADGADGAQGPAGEAGPNEVSTATASSISGILKGSSGKLAAAVAGTDYLAPSEKGTANGLASLDAHRKLTAEQASAYPIYVSASKTLTLTDAGTLQRVYSASSVTITVPTSSRVAFPINTEIEIFRSGSGAVTIAAASGVTFYCKETSYTIKDQYTSAVLKKIAADVWLLQGNLG